MLNELESSLWNILQSRPQGISEFELLRQLQHERDAEFDPNLFRDNLAMYRSHFLLFHALYRLRDYLRSQQLAALDIHVLKIQLQVWESTSPGSLSTPDQMREYYLDLEHMENTSLEDIENLLGQFWTHYYVDQKRDQALAVLDLAMTAGRDEIEQRYRNLAMKLHPDRGGDEKQFQDLQQAITILRRSTA